MVQMRSHQELAALHAAAPSFVPSIPVTSLPYIAFILLASAFLSAFYFTTLPKRSLTPTEVTVALLASLEVGFGVVALFNAVGVYV
ncbi:uncharacterized protein PFL1_03106 [Pseudozyma flocculosa PF-1]|uniref:Dolichyl-diphosphooligosaccharide-protein glycosyltransferase subunit OST5 n=1 Tax=Pseudozyma flocculosa PF-1 TaxID=1277687 RepID=A0A061HFE0_9BASI|nr:uncharacterized protein PFL1_03106 [Pseudozyma flocculosa PF-1]EPQ29351.1 hypothetical protein PFL1_03106 [Pseudozyma flocculosa PF-1]